jgi:Ca2+-binding RTX toxin-like protein
MAREETTMATIEGNWLPNIIDVNDGVTTGNDTIFGYNGSDALYGWDGNDEIWSGNGNFDYVDGGSGRDTAVYLDSTSGVEVVLNVLGEWSGRGQGSYGTADGDTLISIENVTGSSYADVLIGDGFDNILDGAGGRDHLEGGQGDDTLIGGAGGDELWGGQDENTASYVTASSGVTASLQLGGTGGDAAGDVFYYIQNLTGSSHGDTLEGDQWNNTLEGGGGADTLVGHGGRDRLVGGNGADVLRGGEDGDTLMGGSGSDTAAYAESWEGVTVNLDSGLGFDGTAEGDTFDSIENITGSGHDDDFTGDDEDNWLRGFAGNDTLKGGGGIDILDGGADIDTVRYGDSDEGVEIELLSGTGSGGTAEGDTLIRIENVVGSAHADTLAGNEENNTLEGAGGDDWLKGGGGADILDGGAGNDTATYINYGSGVTVSLFTGTGSGGAAEGDTLTDIENLYGTAYVDSLTGDNGANILHGDDGDDTLRGGGGADRLIGGTGRDTATYASSTAAVMVNLTSGLGSGGAAEGDTLNGVENLIGSGSADTLVGDGESNTLAGEGGRDTLWGGIGGDTLDGGGGIDTALYIESAAAVDVNLTTGIGLGGTAQGDTLTDTENVTGSAFDDTLTGDDEGNVLSGAGGIDVLKGGGGTDTLDGGGQNDWLAGGEDGDTLNGGSGLDFAAYGTSASGVIVNLANGLALLGDAAGDTFDSIENLSGSDFGDFLTGDGGNNILLGQAGNDTLVGGGGTDLMMGSLDDDTYIVDSALDVVTEFGGDGNDTVRTSVSYRLAPGTDVEVLRTTDDFGATAIDLTGNNTNNEIVGNDGANVITGGGGADHLVGRDGNDTYVVDVAAVTIAENAGRGTDTVLTSVSYVLTAGADIEFLATTDDNGTGIIDLTGNAAGNVVRGNNGNNVIGGGDGNDELTGRSGQDRFVFNTALNPTSNLDEITDFNVADDTILLDDTVFTTLAAGSLVADQFVIGTAAQDANDRIVYNSATGALFYDTDGVGAAAAVQFSELSAGLALTHLDFLVI